MKEKILNLILIVSSLFGYLEWGADQKMFLWQGEWDVITKLFTNPLSVIHPLTLLPLIGQICLLITLFQKQPSKRLTFAGLGGIALLFIVILIVGLISSNYKIFLSTLPFLITAMITISYQLKKKKGSLKE